MLPDQPARRRRAPLASATAADQAHGVLLDDLDFLLATARHAPSPGDRRPWRFRVRHGALELLTAAHPGGSEQLSGHTVDRQDLIACGAALFNLRLALDHLGRQPRIRLLPDPENPTLLAQVTADTPRGPGDEEEYLFAAVARRHTRRAPFARPDVPPELLGHLTAAAALEGTGLVRVPAGHGRDALTDALSAAETLVADDPAAAAGLRAPWVSLLLWADGASCPLAVLTTPSDTPGDWLRAGQALQRLLLTATTARCPARFFTLVLQNPELRERVRVDVCGGAFPQVILEFGQGSAPAG